MIETEVGMVFATLPVAAFSIGVKKLIRERQENECGRCGREPDILFCHHRIPQSMGGADDPINGLGLCRECHLIADNRALRDHKLLDGTPIREAPEELFK